MVCSFSSEVNTRLAILNSTQAMESLKYHVNLSPDFNANTNGLWTEEEGDEPETWLIVNEISGPIRLRLGEKEFACLAFEEMILTLQRQPVHLNIEYVTTSGRRVLIRRWEGDAGAKQGHLETCKAKKYKGHTWRQNYDVLSDVFLRGDGKT